MNIKIVGFYHRKTPPYNVAVGGTKGRFFWILFTYKIKKNISIAHIGVSSLKIAKTEIFFRIYF